MATKDKKGEKAEKANEPKKELPTKKHKLITDVSIGGEIHKKGTSYPLTEKGRKYFKSQNYIK